MPDNETPTPEELKAAIQAGWNPADGDPPFRHTLPPDNDSALGNNGIAPTDAEQVL